MARSILSEVKKDSVPISEDQFHEFDKAVNALDVFEDLCCKADDDADGEVYTKIWCLIRPHIIKLKEFRDVIGEISGFGNYGGDQ